MTKQNDKENEDGSSKLTWEELMAELKDPAILQAAAAKYGMEIKPKGQEKKEESKTQIPKIEIPEDATPQDIVEAMNKAFVGVIAHFKEVVESKVGEVKGEISKSKEELTAKEVREFAASHPDLKDLIPIVEPLWASGRFTLEQAYKIAKGEKGKGKESKDKETSEEAQPRSSVKASQEAEPENLKPKTDGVKDALKKNLGKYIEEHGSEFLNETEE